MKEYKHGLYTQKVQHDPFEIRDTCSKMYDFISNTFADGKDYNGNSTLVSGLFSKYNFLMYPLPGIHQLYKNIQNVFNESYERYYGKPNTEQHFIQCWLNYYWKHDFIDWHGHWPSKYRAWHGFFCVQVGTDSKTSYQWKDGALIDIPSEDGLVVMGISDGDKHRSSEWMHSNPRITVAFDIVPVDNAKIKPEQYINHWIPI